MYRNFESLLVGFVAILSLFLFTMPALAADWTESYCSSQNTGSSSDVYAWDYQSNGNCTNHCNQVGTFAFAVIQYTDCWCSDYIPADQQDVADCHGICPGFPSENCGDKKENLYIYIEMDGQPSGTQGGAQPTTSAAASSAAPSSTEAPPPPSTAAPAPPQVVTSLVTPDPETVIKTVLGAAPFTTVTSPAASTSTPSEEKDEPSTTSPTTTAAPNKPTDPTSTEEPMTMPTVVTISGVVTTQTIVITPTSAPSRTGNNENKTNVGAIAGGVAGGVVGLLAIAGIAFLLWRRKRQQSQQQGDQDGTQSGITRNVSTMSRAGLLGGRSEKQAPPPIITTFGSQRTQHDNESITPATATSRRLSQPMIVDSRLNPNAVLAFHGANFSRESLGSIDDSQDYGRQLNVRNPDP